MIEIDNKENLIEKLADKALLLMQDWENNRAMQKRFVVEYIKLGFTNATQAARNAGYSDKTSKSQAHRLLTNVDFKHVQDTISEVQEEFERLSIELSIADSVEIAQFLTRVMRREETNQIVLKKSEDEEILVEAKAEIRDAIKAAELLGKSYGQWNEKSDDSDIFEKLDKVLGKIDSAF